MSRPPLLPQRSRPAISSVWAIRCGWFGALEQCQAPRRRTYSVGTTSSVDIKASRPISAMGGGEAVIAVGVEARRENNYNDVCSTTNPKLALRLNPAKEILVRSS
jgi:hypothetical protein